MDAGPGSLERDPLGLFAVDMTRRRFLQLTAGAAAASMFPVEVLSLRVEAATPADLTTLARTIVKGGKLRSGSMGSYYLLAPGPGEPHILRTELTAAASNPVRRSLLHFAHFTDTHIQDSQSPARVEFLDRFADPGAGCQAVPFNAAYHPHDSLTLHTFEAMIRQVRAVALSPVTGAPLAFAICTGDNTDNEHYNELRWFIDTFDGNHTVTPNSGGPTYEGVQSASWNDPEYWHPDAGVTDKYKDQWGFPDYPGLLTQAIQPFSSTGIGMPWYQTFGNHDGLLQGNAPTNPFLDAIAVGSQKVTGPPPGANPCDAFTLLRNDPAALFTAPPVTVTADPARRPLKRLDYIKEMFKTTGAPVGHGLGTGNLADGTAYWVNDSHPGFRLIGLDTVNPGGYNDGSIGQGQLTWLEARLQEVSSRYLDSSGTEVTHNAVDRLVILFSHHGLRSLTNPASIPNPGDPTSNDLPRVMAATVEALLHRYRNVVAWVNGHTHSNVVTPRPAPSGGSGFWDIGTAAHLDWSCQSRLLEIVDNQNGTISIFGTMVDHAAPVTPGGGDPVLRLASISRELAANDYQYGFASKGPGTAQDRNVELLVKAPFRLAPPPAAPSPSASATPALLPNTRTSAGPSNGGSALAGGAALAAAAWASRGRAGRGRGEHSPE
jgi:metallophosphoesterase (TIGR03767 family)